MAVAALASRWAFSAAALAARAARRWASSMSSSGVGLADAWGFQPPCWANFTTVPMPYPVDVLDLKPRQQARTALPS